MRNEKGSAAIILVISFSVIAMFAVVGVDVGAIVYEKAELSNALDSAALAGAQALPNEPDEAIAIAVSYLSINGVDPQQASISIDADNRGITINATQSINTFFGPLIELSTIAISEQSKVRVGPVGRVRSGIRPLVIENQPLGYGDVVALKLNASENYHGNFGAVSLGGNGACIYRNNLLYGYSGSIEIGDVIYTEPGNMASVINPLRNHLSSDYSTFDNYSRDSDRLWVIPIVDSLNVSGASPVTVVGFAEFFIEEIGRQSGQTNIEGRFIRFSGGGVINEGAPDFGLYAINLVP